MSALWREEEVLPWGQVVSGRTLEKRHIWMHRGRVETGRDGDGGKGWKWAEEAVRRGRKARAAGARS